MLINFTVCFKVLRSYGLFNTPDLLINGYDVFVETYNLFLGNFADS